MQVKSTDARQLTVWKEGKLQLYLSYDAFIELLGASKSLQQQKAILCRRVKTTSFCKVLAFLQQN